MTVRYVVVDGPDGEALAQRQADAVRHALAWLATHPDHRNRHDPPGEAHNNKSTANIENNEKGRR